VGPDWTRNTKRRSLLPARSAIWFAADKAPILEEDDPQGSRLLLAESLVGGILIAGCATSDSDDSVAAGKAVHDVDLFGDGFMYECIDRLLPRQEAIGGISRTLLDSDQMARMARGRYS
jgi:hypothetical protein